MAIREGYILIADTIAEVLAATTDCPQQSMHCIEDNVIYRKYSANGSLVWRNPKQMLKGTYDANENNIVDDSEKLGGQLPTYYAKQSDLTTAQSNSQTAMNLANDKESPLTFTAPLSRTGNTVSLPNLSGTNTGDESQNSILTKIGYTPESQTNKSTSVDADKASSVKYPTVKALYDWTVSLFVQKNADIVPGTKAKITYDAKGLITSGADLTATDIPTIPTSKVSGLSAVATSGSYTDLSNKPTVPAAQIQSDWTQTNNASSDFIKNKPPIVSSFTTGGAANVTKRWLGLVTPTTAQGFSIDISSASFANVLTAQVIAIKGATLATDCPQVSIKSYTNSAIVVNITQGSTTTVGVLGVVVNSLLFPASVTGITLFVLVEGN